MDRTYTQDEYDTKLQQAPLIRTSFRSNPAGSGHFGVPRSHSPSCAATFALRKSTLPVWGALATIRRSELSPLTFHSRDRVTGRLELVLCEPFTLKEGGFGDGG